MSNYEVLPQSCKYLIKYVNYIKALVLSIQIKMQGMPQGFLWLGNTLKDMENCLEIKSISTGTVTRIDPTKASSNFYFIYVLVIHIHNIHSLLITVGWVFPVMLHTSMLIIIWINLTFKVSNDSKLIVSVQLALKTLTVCKSHKQYIVYYKLA